MCAWQEAEYNAGRNPLDWTAFSGWEYANYGFNPLWVSDIGPYEFYRGGSICGWGGGVWP